MTIRTSVQMPVVMHRDIAYATVDGAFYAIEIGCRGEAMNTSTSKANVSAFFPEVLHTNITRGIIKHDNLMDYLEGKPLMLEPLVDVSLEYLEELRVGGFNSKKLIALDSDRSERKETLLTRMEAKEDIHLMHLDYGSHLVYDAHGNILPVAIPFDYINGCMSNGAYDMEKALRVLVENPQVHFIGASTLGVEMVPYYNSRPDSSSFLQFYFAPTQEQMTAIWERAKTLDRTFPSTALNEAVFELDTLGLRAAGAALFNNFYERLDIPDSPDDDFDDCP